MSALWWVPFMGCMCLAAGTGFAVWDDLREGGGAQWSGWVLAHFGWYLTAMVVLGMLAIGLRNGWT